MMGRDIVLLVFIAFAFLVMTLIDSFPEKWEDICEEAIEWWDEHFG